MGTIILNRVKDTQIKYMLIDNKKYSTKPLDGYIFCIRATVFFKSNPIIYCTTLTIYTNEDDYSKAQNIIDTRINLYNSHKSISRIRYYAI